LEIVEPVNEPETHNILYFYRDTSCGVGNVAPHVTNIRFTGIWMSHDHYRFLREGHLVYFKLGDTAYFGFCTHNPNTGAVANASSTPTCEIFEENSESAIAYAPTVVQRGEITGEYVVPVVVSTENSFETDKNYIVIVTAIVAGVTGKKVVGSFYLLSKKLSDLNDIAAPDLSNLDAAVSTRSTLTAQQVWEYATRTLSSFGTLVADIWGAGTRTLTSFGSLAADATAAVWASVTRSLTDKAGFSISGTKQTLDALNDLSQAGAQAGAAAALNTYDPPTKAELDSGLSPLALEATLTAIKGAGWNTQTLAAIFALVDDLEGRLTAARAGYLDELAAANLPADVDTLLGRLTAVRAAYLDASIASRSTASQGATKAELDAAQLALETAIDNLEVPPPEGVALEATLEAMKGVGWIDESLKDIREAIDGIGASAGAGAITWIYTLTRSDTGLPIADADVWVSTDVAGANVVASGRTNQNGVVTFHLDAGTVYIWRQKSGFNFVNPDTEVVS
jgi:hypothetical protein